MFGRRDAMDELEATKLASLKLYLSRELSVSIKKLQRDHISSDSAIRSGETANRICNLIEAVYLHHLKETYSIKTPWPFLVKFTHKDVVSQLKRLSQVNTEIGYCRAWVRLALNDSLMDSYMDAMLSDTKAIHGHYKKTSFLRDAEQPHIMKNYLQGLVNFTFQLSFNSSLLNVWGAAPMILAGSWETVRERSESCPNNSRKIVTGGPPLGIQQVERPIPDSSGRTRDPKPIGATATVAVTSGQALPRSPSFDESFHECEISSALLRSPSEESSTSPLRRIGGFALSSPEQDEKEEEEEEPGRDLVRIRQDSFEDGVVIHVVSDDTPENDTNPASAETVYPSFDGPKRDDFHSKSDNRDAETADREQERRTKLADIASEAPSDARAVERIAEDASSETPSDAQEPESRTRPGDVTPEGPSHAGETDFYPDTLPSAENPSAPIPPPPPEVTTELHEGAVDDQRSREEAIASPPEEEKEEEEEDVQAVFGNSLVAMSGWSSEFHNQLSPEMPSQDAAPHVSYNSMLEDYSRQGPQPPTSFPDALDQSRSLSFSSSTDGTEPSHGRPLSDPSEIPADFEVIPLSSSPTSQYADARTQSLLAMVTEIGREKGLDSQSYQCKGCSRPVGIIYGKAKVCNYNGCYYCYECHKDEEAIIPARILYNWDFRKHKVAVHTKLFLQQIEEMPLLDIKECNPSLYKASQELNNVLRVRMQLKYLKAYLFTCKQSVAEELRKKIWPREYMLDHVHRYSVLDFLQVQSGLLIHTLRKVIVFAAKHVQQCALCSQKGFICLICESPKIIYPFDTDLTVRCDSCKTVFHKACKADTTPCPKCERRLLRKQQLRPSPENLDFASPFT